jgi:hypothetical protein
MNIGLSDLSLLCADIVLMSHVHKPQEWMFGDTEILYMGSPYRTTYGEVEDKSVVRVDLDDRRAAAPSWTRIPTPCAGMYLVEDAWENGEFVAGAHGLPSVSDIVGSEIRFRYTVEPDERAQAEQVALAWKQRWLDAGAIDVKVEPEVATSTRARVPEVAAAMTLGDKLMALWKSRDTTPEPPRAERLISMAGDLEKSAS